MLFANSPAHGDENDIDPFALVDEGVEVATRKVSITTYDNDRFVIGIPKFAQQYASLYFVRLNLIRPALMERCKSLTTAVVCNSLLEVKEGESCVLIGTTYKNMKLKPCVLDEFLSNDELSAPPCPVLASELKGCFVSEDDTIELEDEHSRFVLEDDAVSGFKIPVDRLVTGVVAGFQGFLLDSGKFRVQDIIYPGLSTPIPPFVASDDKFVIFVSGFNLGDPSANPILVQLFIDQITGAVGRDEDRHAMSSISRIIICGDSLCDRSSLTDSRNQPKLSMMAQKNKTSEISPSLKQLDLIISQLCSSVDVDLLPGDFDPTNVALPQQPIHQILLPKAALHSTFNRLTNPAQITTDGVVCLGSSGQNVTGLLQYSSGLSECDALESLLNWGQLAPTCPDTLSCFPFSDRDPFVIKQTPHVFFAGNQEQFETRIMSNKEGTSVRLISIPVFSKTGCAVVLNLRTLECETMTFSSN